jgi:hypothetical protein
MLNSNFGMEIIKRILVGYFSSISNTKKYQHNFKSQLNIKM